MTVSDLVKLGGVSGPTGDHTRGAARPQNGATLTAPGWRFLVGWTTAWLAVGLVVAIGISFGAQVEFFPVLRVSLLFAQVVGYSAYTSARLVSPFLAQLPFTLRLFLDTLSLLAGTFFGSIIVVQIEPYFLLGQVRINLLILGLNSLLAAIVAIALGTYDRMKGQIVSSYRIQVERDALQHELSVARQVQRQLLPREVPDSPSLELAGICQQAIEVGGDYYDYIPIEDGRLGLVIADVSGKGVPAALLMANLQASTRSLFLKTEDPGELNGRLNNALYRASSEGRYATAFLAIYDGKTHQLSYSRAGHLPALVIRGPLTIECLDGGMPIGMLPDSTYDTGTQTLASGDLLVMFTDGVTETASPDDEHFGPERLADLLRANRQKPLPDLIQITTDALRRWSGPIDAHDDVTLVLARIR